MSRALRDAIHAHVIGVDEVVIAAEAKWGPGRLVRLVSDETRLRFRDGADRWGAAIRGSDLEAVKTLAPKMRQAWLWMDLEATQLGGKSLAEISPLMLEARRDDGVVVRVVQDYDALRAAPPPDEGRAVISLTMAEVARLALKTDLITTLEEEGLLRPSVAVGECVDRETVNPPGFAETWAGSREECEMIYPEVA